MHLILRLVKLTTIQFCGSSKILKFAARASAYFLCFSSVVYAAPLSTNDMVDFLAQSLCINSSGKPTSQLPIIDNCPIMRPQRTDDQAIYRKRDWPDTRAPGLLAHQASDSVLAISGAEPVVEQTFDFGDLPGRSFGHFDKGDNGQVVMLTNGWADIVMTEDLTAGIQWFVGTGCKRSVVSGTPGWLLFNQNTPTGTWAHIIASTALDRSFSDCPQQFNQAFTRYRRERIVFPFRLVNGGNVTIITRPLDVMITDHFGGTAANPASNAHLERFYSARHFGLVRWERWDNGDNDSFKPQRAKLQHDMQDLDASGRCPAIAYSTAPGSSWYRVDCRTWTTIVRIFKPWAVEDFGWRAFSETKWK